MGTYTRLTTDRGHELSSQLLNRVSIFGFPPSLRSTSTRTLTSPTISPNPYLIWIAMPRKKVRPEDKKKPGPRGLFKGLRAEFMESKQPLYRSAHARRELRSFWDSIIAEYFKRVDWRHPLNSENEVDAEVFRDASFPQDEDLSDEEELKRAVALTKMRKVSTSYLIYKQLAYTTL